MIKPLTSLRFFLAAYIFIFHSRTINFKGSGISAYINNVIMDGGYCGVTFFFMLSGFVIAYAYHDRLNTIEYSQMKKFFISRFARIYPIYFLIMLFAAPLSISNYGVEKFADGFPLGLTLTQSLSPQHWGRVIGPGWALSNEVVFYALTPFLFAGIAFLRGSVNDRKTWARASAISALLIWIVTSALLLKYFPGVGKKSWLLYVAPYFRFPEYVIGVMMGHAFLSMDAKNVRLGKTAFTILEFAAIAIFLASLALRPYFDPVLQNGMFFVPVFAFMIGAFYFHGGAISDILSSGAFVLLGNISFAFFLIHNPIQGYFHKIPSFSGFSGVAIIAVEFVTALLASIAIYKWIEEPLRGKIIARYSQAKATNR